MFELLENVLWCAPAVLSSLAISDPMKIITDPANNNLTNGGLFWLLDLGALFYLIKKNALIIGTIVVAVLLITLIYMDKTEDIANRKKDIYHKLLVIFIICSSATLFGWAKKAFDVFLF